MDTTKDIANHATLGHESWDDGSTIIRAAKVPWTQWALPGTWFKLLDYDRNHSYTCILLRIDPTAPETVHKHIGGANALILQGGFSYEHGSVREGDYMCEAGGVTHTPTIHPDGCTMLGFMHGCVVGYNEDGTVAGVVDVDWMIDQAKANNAFGHLDGVRRS